MMGELGLAESDLCSKRGAINQRPQFRQVHEENVVVLRQKSTMRQPLAQFQKRSPYGCQQAHDFIPHVLAKSYAELRLSQQEFEDLALKGIGELPPEVMGPFPALFGQAALERFSRLASSRRILTRHAAYKVARLLKIASATTPRVVTENLVANLERICQYLPPWVELGSECPGLRQNGSKLAFQELLYIIAIMSPFEFILSLFAICVFAGFFGSLVGLGGGIIVVPALTLIYGVDIHYAIGASIVSVLATSSGAAAA